MKKLASFMSIILLTLAGLKAQQTDTVLQAKELIKVRNFQQAVLLLDEYLKGKAEDTLVYEMCGDAYVELNLYNQAAQRYSKALIYCKNNSPLVRKRAISYFLLQEYRSAKPEWQAVCKTDPNQKQNWYYLGLVQAKLANDKEALKALNKALELDGNFIEARMARAELNLRGQRYKEVLVDIDTALKVLQYTEDLFVNRGLALLGLKRYPEAVQMFERVLKKNEQNVHAWFGLGNVHYNTKNFEQAIAAFDKAIQLKPNFELAYFKRGMAKMEIKQTQEGCKDLLKSASFGYADAIYYVQKYCNGVK
jgi:tetratricopeptide (TPR) repeat protein